MSNSSPSYPLDYFLCDKQDIANSNISCSQYNLTALFLFGKHLETIHGHLAITLCSLGILLNTIVVVVLTQASMRNPFNMILTGVSICDIATMTTYLYYAAYFYIATEPSPSFEKGHSYTAIIFILIHNFVSITGHVIATLFTVMLAFFRFIALYFPTDGPTWCSVRRTKICLISIAVISVIASAPNWGMYQPCVVAHNSSQGWWFQVHPWMKFFHLETLNMYIYGIFVKIMSSLLNCIFSGMLLNTLRQVNIRRRRLKKDLVRSKEARSLREHTRTTVLLVAVVATFTITEFPQGCLNLAAAVNDCIFAVVYMQLGNLMDILVLINSASSFFWLYGMSTPFREMFAKLFIPKIRTKRKRTNILYLEITANGKSKPAETRGQQETQLRRDELLRTDICSKMENDRIHVL